MVAASALPHQGSHLLKNPGKKYYFEPGAPTTIFSAAVISGSISAGNPITISSSAIPENFREPSHPSEKFGRPVR